MPNLNVEVIGGAGLGPLIPDDVLTPVAREAVPELFSCERQLASSARPHTRRPLSSHSSSSGAHTTLARREVRPLDLKEPRAAKHRIQARSGRSAAVGGPNDP